MKATVVPNVKRVNPRPIIKANVAPGSTISSDELSTIARWQNGAITTGQSIMAMMNGFKGIHHVNRIEGFWSHLKRGIRSTHISVSRHHLQHRLPSSAFPSRELSQLRSPLRSSGGINQRLPNVSTRRVRAPAMFRKLTR
ncbi:MAG: transposase [Burkholderiales bacterium]|nr:transposase [Burkholderiales bacterium]